MKDALAGVKGHKAGHIYAIQKRGFRNALAPKPNDPASKKRQLGYNLLVAYNKFVIAYERYLRWEAATVDEKARYFISQEKQAASRLQNKPYTIVKDIAKKQPTAASFNEGVKAQLTSSVSSLTSRLQAQAQKKVDYMA